MSMFHVPLVQGAKDRLQAQFALLDRGSDLDLVTPIIGRKTTDKMGKRDQVASDVWSRCKLDQLPMWLRELEVQQRGMHGSYSNLPPYDDSTLPLGVGAFFNTLPNQVSIDKHAAKIADTFVLSRLSKGTLTRCLLEDAAMSFEGRTSYGWPFVSSNPSFFDEAMGMSMAVIASNNLPTYLAYPAILGFRGTPTGLHTRPKARVVWQCSRVIANIEKTVFIPVFKALQHSPGFAAWTSAKDVEFSITRMFDAGRAGTVMSVDFSKFDSSLPREIIGRVFSFLSAWFGSTYDKAIIGALCHYFQGVQLLTPRGLHINKLRGVPSGSVMTNLVDSLANMWVIAYGAAKLGSRVSDCEVQGDDGVYRFNVDITPPELKGVLREDLGMTINPDKGLIAENEVHFLQNVYRRSYRDKGLCLGVRPIMRVLNGMMSYERFHSGWNGYLDTARWVMQMSNASEHPSFYALVEWLLDQDDYLQGSPQSIVDKAGGPDVVRRFLGKKYEGSSLDFNTLFCRGMAAVTVVRAGQALEASPSVQ